MPNSTVAAITPKTIAARSPDFSNFTSWLLAAGLALVLLALAACTESTAPAKRFPVLDDVGSSDWQTVSVGGAHSCALKADGAAYCWGSNSDGQLGIASTDTTCGDANSKYGCSLTPKLVQSAPKFIAISAGQRHTCGISVQHEAFCWGANDQSQLGAFSGGGPTLVKVQGALPWAQISAGYTHTCAVRSDGALFCWGQNDRGEIGDGGFFNAALPLRVSLPAPVASVTTGQSRTCARTTVGTVYCWGAVWVQRQDGLELTRAQQTPQLVPSAPAMTTLSVGSFTTCGADRSGIAYCWEANPRGEMGDGTTEGSTAPKPISSNLGFVQLSSGIVQTCGIVTNGAAYCWGDNSFGELGIPNSLIVERCADGTLPCSTTPKPVLGRQSFIDISTGFGSHSCGVSTKGNLYCWGLGASGQRGDGTMKGAITTPSLVVEPH